MNCRDCQTKICDLSADALESCDVVLMREHLEECSACKAEMAILERTLFSVSCATQNLPSPLASEQMWHRCSEHIFQKVEAERVGAKQPAAASPVPQREYSLQGNTSWFSRQPRWSWTTLGGALMILASAWFFNLPESSSARSFPVADNSPGELVALRRPTGAASVFVNHHSAMSVDPFTDYVGTTLVSYSATSNSSPNAAARR